MREGKRGLEGRWGLGISSCIGEHKRSRNNTIEREAAHSNNRVNPSSSSSSHVRTHFLYYYCYLRITIYYLFHIPAVYRGYCSRICELYVCTLCTYARIICASRHNAVGERQRFVLFLYVVYVSTCIVWYDEQARGRWALRKSLLARRETRRSIFFYPVEYIPSYFTST